VDVVLKSLPCLCASTDTARSLFARESVYADRVEGEVALYTRLKEEAPYRSTAGSLLKSIVALVKLLLAVCRSSRCSPVQATPCYLIRFLES
jgi:hypothetical protein